jgi:hypothetical protein
MFGCSTIALPAKLATWPVVHKTTRYGMTVLSEMRSVTS